MAKTINKCNCWVFINPDQQNRPYKNLEQETAKVLNEFMEDKYPESGIQAFTFNIYIQPKINFGLHRDFLSKESAHLAMHIDKTFFDNSSEGEKLKLILATTHRLLTFLNQMAVPKGCNVSSLANDFNKYLITNSLLPNDSLNPEIFIKHFETTRFNFLITTTMEVDKKRIHLDLIELEHFINNQIAGKTFGKSITSIEFGHELYAFDGEFAHFMKQTMNLRRYSPKYKTYLVVKHFDYTVLKELDKKQQFEILRSKILEGINDFDTLTKKPKDFDKNAFFETISKSLSEYESKL